MKYNWYTFLQFIVLAGLSVLIPLLDLDIKLKLLIGGSLFLIITLLMDIRGLLLYPEKAKSELTE